MQGLSTKHHAHHAAMLLFIAAGQLCAGLQQAGMKPPPRQYVAHVHFNTCQCWPHIVPSPHPIQRKTSDDAGLMLIHALSLLLLVSRGKLA